LIEKIKCNSVYKRNIFSYIMAGASYIWWNYDDFRFVLDQHN
jgi:hypothetical protein